MAAVQRSKVVSAFKLNGLSLKSESSQYLTEILASVSCDELDIWLDRIIENVQKQPLSSSLINKNIVKLAVQECSNKPEDKSDKAFCLISAFEVPRFRYNPDRKKFLQCPARELNLHADAKSRAELFQDRYSIIYQRTLRHDLFAPTPAGAHPGQKTNKYELKLVEFLLGSTAKLGKIIILGMIAQIKEGRYYLEDATGVVEIDLSKTTYHSGLFTENCFVLAEGMLEDNIFKVEAIGCPPLEPSQVTRNYFGNINFFGGPSPISVKASEKFLAIEKESQEAMFVILSEVYLDLPRVLKKLRTLFEGYSVMPPTLFLFCGNFISQPYGGKQSSTFRDAFKNLASLIAEFPALLSSSRFIFVPGPHDPGPGNVLPRPPIPSCLIQEVQHKITHSMFATNPCRIQYCTQEIVVFREDLVNKMCRNCIRLPEDLTETPGHLVKTILSQAHLCPLPHHKRPIYWNYDHGLRIYPVPDLIILADKYPSYVENTNIECTAVNPGSFSRNGYCFNVYWPATREVEESQIQD